MNRRFRYLAASMLLVLPAAGHGIVLDDFNDGGIGAWQGIGPQNSFVTVDAGTTLSNVDNALRLFDPGFTHGATVNYLGALPQGVSVVRADVRVVSDNGWIGNWAKLAAKPGGYFTASTQGSSSVAFARSGVDNSNSPFRQVAVAVVAGAPTDLTLLLSGNIATLASPEGEGAIELEIDNVQLDAVTGEPQVLDDFTVDTGAWQGATWENAPLSDGVNAFSQVTAQENTALLIDVGGGRAGWVSNYSGVILQGGTYVVTCDVRINNAGGEVTDLRMAVAPGIQLGTANQTWPFSASANFAAGGAVTSPTPFFRLAAAISFDGPGDLAVYIAQDVLGNFVTSFSNTQVTLEIDRVDLWGPFGESDFSCESDIDGDGVCDEQEATNTAIVSTDGRSNVLLPDSDSDGLRDGEEDTNRNGMPDPGETMTRNRDSDGDGFEDGLEVLFMHTDPLAFDEGFVDNDNDGLPASLDPDDGNPDMDGDRYDDLYDALVFRDLAAAQDARHVPNLGDVNGDGEAGNLDALVIQALFLNVIDHGSPVFQVGGPGYDGFRHANPSRTGQAGNLDSLAIQAHFLGNLTTFPLRLF